MRYEGSGKIVWGELASRVRVNAWDGTQATRSSARLNIELQAESRISKIDSRYAKVHGGTRLTHIISGTFAYRPSILLMQKILLEKTDQSSE